MRKFSIIWENIADPFESRNTQGVVPRFPNIQHSIFDSLKHDIDDDDDEDDDDDDDDEPFFPHGMIPKGMSLTKGIITQAGILPVNESWNPFKGFYGHANFVITRNIQNIILEVPGVEAFRAISPYRFKIAFARHWENNIDSVKAEILLGLTKYLNSVYNI